MGLARRMRSARPSSVGGEMMVGRGGFLDRVGKWGALAAAWASLPLVSCHDQVLQEAISVAKKECLKNGVLRVVEPAGWIALKLEVLSVDGRSPKVKVEYGEWRQDSARPAIHRSAMNIHFRNNLVARFDKLEVWKVPAIRLVGEDDVEVAFDCAREFYPDIAKLVYGEI
jgi:hypothetical protein